MASPPPPGARPTARTTRQIARNDLYRDVRTYVRVRVLVTVCPRRQLYSDAFEEGGVRERRGEGGGVKRFENGGRLSFLPDEEANIYRSRRHDDRFSVRLKRSPRREEGERD